jgi:hypothetical protein
MSADNNKPEKRPGKFGKLLNFIVSVFGVLIIWKEVSWSIWQIHQYSTV